MKKLTSLFCLLLVTVMILSSCGGEKTAKLLEGYVYKEQTPTLTMMAEVTALEGYTLQESVGDLVSLKKVTNMINSYAVYNVVTNNIVWAHTDTSTDAVQGNLKLYTTFGQSFFAVVMKRADSAEAQYKSMLISSLGAVITTVPKKLDISDLDYSFDLIRFHNDTFRLNDNGTVSLLKAGTALSASLPTFDRCTDNYYYDFNAETGGVFVYDKDLNPVSSWSSSVTGASVNFHLLKGDRVLIQSMISCPDSSENYTVLDDTGKKLLLKTVLFEAENGDEKEKDFDYVVTHSAASDEYGEDGTLVLAETPFADVDTLGMVSYIKDERISTDYKTVTLSSAGKVKDTYFTDLPMQTGMIDTLGADRFVYGAKNGQIYLIDKNATVIGDATGVADGEFNECYLIAGGCIYDYNLTMLYDYAAQGMKLEEVLGHGVLLSKENSTYLFVNGVATCIAMEGSGKELVECNRFCFLLRDTNLSSGAYTAYNDQGVVLGTFDHAFSSTGSSTDDNTVVLLSSKGLSGTTKYFVLCK